MLLKSAVKKMVKSLAEGGELVKATDEKPKSELIKGVLKKNGYISEPVQDNRTSGGSEGYSYEEVFGENKTSSSCAPHGEQLEKAFQDLDISNVQDLSNEINGNDFNLAVQSMMEEDRSIGGGTPGKNSKSISRISDDSRLLDQTMCSQRNTYAASGKRPDPMWHPPEHIISNPSAKLRRTTKATEAQKYDTSRRPVTPQREALYRKYHNTTEAQTLLHTDAETIFRVDRLKQKNKEKGYIKNAPRSPGRRTDPTRPTVATTNSRYEKKKEESIVWSPPAVIVEPSPQLTRTTRAVAYGAASPPRAKTPEQKREQGWSRPNHHNHSLLDLNELTAHEKRFQGNLKSRARSPGVDSYSRGRGISVLQADDRLKMLTSLNAARRADQEVLRQREADKVQKPVKKQKPLTNQRLVEPTLSLYYSMEELEYMRNSVRAEDDPFWDKRRGKVLPPTANKYASTPSKLLEPTQAIPVTKRHAPPPPPKRAKSPGAPVIPPSAQLLQETESGISRIRSGSELRSLSARSSVSSQRGGSVTSHNSRSNSASRSVRSVSSSVVSERLLQPTESQIHSVWVKKNEMDVLTKSPGRGSGGQINADLIERLERKTASIVYSQWNGSEKEKIELLELARARQRKLSADRAATLPNGGVSPRLMLETACTEKLRRTVSPGRVKEKDPLDIGEGWYEKHHIATEQERRAGAHLQYHVGELTSRNYQSPYTLKSSSSRDDQGKETDSMSPGPVTPGMKRSTHSKSSEKRCNPIASSPVEKENSRSNTPVAEEIVVKEKERDGDGDGGKKFKPLEPKQKGTGLDGEEHETGFSRSRASSRTSVATSEISENSFAIA